MRRQVSVDFTLPEPLLDELRIGPDGPWCVPLAILEKRPLRNFDLREHDEWRSDPRRQLRRSDRRRGSS